MQETIYGPVQHPWPDTFPLVLGAALFRSVPVYAVEFYESGGTLYYIANRGVLAVAADNVVLRPEENAVGSGYNIHPARLHLVAFVDKADAETFNGGARVIWVSPDYDPNAKHGGTPSFQAIHSFIVEAVISDRIPESQCTCSAHAYPHHVGRGNCIRYSPEGTRVNLKLGKDGLPKAVWMLYDTALERFVEGPRGRYMWEDVRGAELMLEVQYGKVGRYELRRFLSAFVELEHERRRIADSD